MSAVAVATRRAAQVRFDAQAPMLPEALPRMDVAAFFGYASAGPLHVPVALEDAAAFTALFGPDLALAPDALTGEPRSGQLGPAVRAFFAGGGRRCWALRAGALAEGIARCRFALPGLRAWDGAAAHDVALYARSAGTGLDDVTCAWALTSDPLVVRAVAGDLLTFGAGTGRTLALGDVLRFTRAGFTVLAAVAEVPAPAQVRLDPARSVSVSADGEVAPSAWLPTAGTLGERIELELHTTGVDGTALLTGLGLSDEHPRWVGSLPADEALYGSAEPPAAGTLSADASAPRFALAGPLTTPATRLLVPLVSGAALSPPAAAIAPPGDARTRNGLATSGADAFLDSRLAGESAAALPALASAVHARDERLRGIHTLLELDEVTIAAVPDAAGAAVVTSALAPPAPGAPGQPAPRPDPLRFEPCGWRVLAAPALHVAAVTTAGRAEVGWTPSDDPGARYLLQLGAGPSDFADPVTLYDGPELSAVVFVAAGAVSYLRVRAYAAGNISDWSASEPADARDPDTGVAVDDGLSRVAALAIHADLIRLCAARRDVFGVLTLAPSTRGKDVARYAHDLAAQLPGEETDLGYAALYHPWTLTGPGPAVSPDGAAAGVLARRAIERGVWIAPAGMALRDIVGLTPSLLAVEIDDAVDAGVNIVRTTPRGVTVLEQSTLAADRDLWPINVRRLLALVIRAALSRGRRYVFEPNDQVLRRAVRRDFEALLMALYLRGAFVGAIAEEAFRVDVGDPPNSDDDRDKGRFLVELRIAPSRPLTFLLVRLVHDGDSGLAVMR